MAPAVPPTVKSPYCDITTYCIPSFFLMIGGEMAMSWVSGHKGVYRVNDTINSISLGTIQQLLGAATAPWFFKRYMQLYQYRLFTIPDTWTAHIGLMLLADFLYYWLHRLSHELNFMWAAHSIHHSSENFNLSTALRQAMFQTTVTAWIGQFPAALMGVPWNLWQFHRSINVVMQFWIHSQYVQELGWIEYVFNTPSQHIIHHSRAPGECNKNYAGWFSIWDQLFGTFELGHRPSKFGVIEQNYSWDPLMHNVKNYWNLFRRMMRFKTLKAKVQWLFSSARFVTDGGINDEQLAKRIRYDPPMTPWQSIYCIGIFAITTVEYLYQSFVIRNKGMQNELLSASYLTLSLCSLAQFMNRSKWATVSELSRWILSCLVLFGGKNEMIQKYMLNDSESAFAQLISCNVGVIIAQMQNRKYQTMAVSGLLGFGLWSATKLIGEMQALISEEDEVTKEIFVMDEPAEEKECDKATTDRSR